jgi:hypothetical protein
MRSADACGEASLPTVNRQTPSFTFRSSVRAGLADEPYREIGYRQSVLRTRPSGSDPRVNSFWLRVNLFYRRVNLFYPRINSFHLRINLFWSRITLF